MPALITGGLIATGVATDDPVLCVTASPVFPAETVEIQS